MGGSVKLNACRSTRGSTEYDAFVCRHWGVEMSKVWDIALGVFLGVMAAALVLGFVANLVAKYQLEEAQKLINSQVQLMQRQLGGMNAPRIEPLRNEQQDGRELARQQKLQAEAEAREKQKNWERSYKPSDKCRADPTTLECANEFMRARKAFDEKGGR